MLKSHVSSSSSSPSSSQSSLQSPSTYKQIRPCSSKTTSKKMPQHRMIKKITQSQHCFFGRSAMVTSPRCVQPLWPRSSAYLKRSWTSHSAGLIWKIVSSWPCCQSAQTVLLSISSCSIEGPPPTWSLISNLPNNNEKKLINMTKTHKTETSCSSSSTIWPWITFLKIAICAAMHVEAEGSVMMLSSFPTVAARATAGLRRSPEMGPKE